MKMLCFLILDLGYPLNSLRVRTRRHRAPLLRVLHRVRLRARMLFALFAAAFRLVVSKRHGLRVATPPIGGDR